MSVTIKRKADSIIITLPSGIDPVDLQNGLRYFKCIDISGRSGATSKDVEELSRTVKSAMARPTISKLKKLDEFKDL